MQLDLAAQDTFRTFMGIGAGGRLITSKNKQNMLNITASKSFMTKQEIKKAAPSVFSTTHASNVSEKYTHIPTSKVVEDMELLGWKVVDAKEVKARKDVGHQKHLVVFRNEDIVINKDTVDTVFPQILLTNSHDGKNAFTFTAGLFRCICENGLVISTEEFGDVKLRHMGYTFEDLQEKIHGMVKELPITIESMNSMKAIELSQKQALAFARKALLVRYSPEELKVITVDCKQLIEPTRVEDEGKDLWSVFNVVQEKMLAGDFTYDYGTKTRKARRIKNFSQDSQINKDLFALAMTYCPN